MAEFTTPIDIPNAEGRSASVNIISGAGTQGIVEFIRLKVKFNATPKNKYCVVIPVINEGERLHNLLLRMKKIEDSK